VSSEDGQGLGQARITSVSISNYRSVGRDVHFTLDPLTVLVGTNGSGKSNIIDAFRFIADCMDMGLGGAINERNGIESVRRWNRSSGGQPYHVTLRVEVRLPDGSAKYTITLAGSRMEEYWIESEEAESRSGAEVSALRVRQGVITAAPSGLAPAVDKQTLALPIVGGDARFRGLFTTLKNLAVYSLYPNVLREPQKYDQTRPMRRHGENWASILKDQEPTLHGGLVAALNKLTGDIDGVQVQRVAGRLVTRFRRTITSKSSQPSRWFDAYQESDGTLRVAGIITALRQEPALPVIGIEEPELTVHPGAIGLIYDHLVEASHRSQVIVTTHSPDLLDLLGDQHAIRVVSRDSERGTRVAPLANSQRETVRSGLMTLGEVLRTEGLQQDLPFGAPDDED
jgi:predicted ATPase